MNFKGCGLDYKGGSLTEEDFENIIKAMSKCGLRQSLPTLRTTYLNITEDIIEQMLIVNGLGAVEVIQNE